MRDGPTPYSGALCAQNRQLANVHLNYRITVKMMAWLAKLPSVEAE